MQKRGRPRATAGSIYKRSDSKILWVRYRDRQGSIVKESSGTSDREGAERFLRSRLDARDDGRLSMLLRSKTLVFNECADWFLEKRSKPPYNMEKSHQENLKVLKKLRPVFGSLRLSEISSEAIEDYIEQRLRSGRRINTKLGVIYRGRLKPTTVHQEFRVLRRILNVAVKQKWLAVNPCQAVEFPVRVHLTVRKPHYMTASEQERIEFFAPGYLRDIVVILVEMGLRPYRELMPMLKSQVDLENRLIHIPDSKTSNGIADMPMTELARDAFKRRIEETLGSEYVFPTTGSGTKHPYITNLKTAWASTLKRAGIPHFSLYELRHTFATRLSAGGVADHFVTQMLRQGDAQVFKRYSQAKLNMMREALNRMDRRANERGQAFDTAQPN